MYRKIQIHSGQTSQEGWKKIDRDLHCYRHDVALADGHGDRRPLAPGMREWAPPPRPTSDGTVGGLRRFCACRFRSVGGARRGKGSGPASLALLFPFGGRCAGRRAGRTRWLPAFHRLKACRRGGSRAGGVAAGTPESSRARRMEAGRPGASRAGFAAAGTPGTRRRPGTRGRPLIQQSPPRSACLSPPPGHVRLRHSLVRADRL